MQNKNISSGIYCIENIKTNKKYIGQSIDINDRWRRHLCELNNNKHYNSYLQNSWNKYGSEMFKFYVLEYCDIEKLDEKEIYYIKLHNTTNRNLGYNLKSGGQQGGSKLSDTSREKLSKSIKNSYSNQELINIRKESAIKQWANKEIKEKIIGKNNGMYGKHHTEESKKKISDGHKGIQSWRRNTTPVICIELQRSFKDATIAGKELSIDGSAILKVCKKGRKTCGGYHWEFLNIGK